MWILRHLVYIAIPAISAYLASDDTLLQWLISIKILAPRFNIDLFQRICLIISIFFSTFILNMRLIYHEYCGERLRKERDGLYNVIKEFVRNNFVSISGNDNFSFNLRILVPEVRILQFLKSMIQHRTREKWFVIRNIEPFAKKDITEHLRFRVEPDKQGLVGLAYETKSIVYDDPRNLSYTHISGVRAKRLAVEKQGLRGCWRH